MKRRKIVIIVVCAMVVIAIVYFMNLDDGKKRYSWFEDYRARSEQPYGTSFIRKMLEGYRPGHEFIQNDSKRIVEVLEDVDDHDRTDYVLIGQDVFLDSESLGALAKFIDAGGNAFIASLTPPEQLLASAYFIECGSPITYDQSKVTSVNLNFYHETLKSKFGTSYAYRVNNANMPYSWDYISEIAFCDSTKSLTPLGFMDDNRVNFVRIAVGRGNLYLHTNPIVFTNYFLTDRKKVAYAEGVFSHLDGHAIIWDEFSKVPLNENDNPLNSPLYFILQQPSLKYAWWLILLTALLYVFFAAKRRQRVIPILDPKTNTSLEFVNMISRLHYNNGNHLDMAQKKMKYFLYFVRSRYGIHAERFRDEHIRRLAEKSRVGLADVEVIFSRYHLIEGFKENIEVNRLADLYDAIDNFYRLSK